MDHVEKQERGRSRERSLNLDKSRRHKRRSGSEQGRAKIGNGFKHFCPWCKPSLAIRAYKTVELKKEVMCYNKRYCEFI